MSEDEKKSSQSGGRDQSDTCKVFPKKGREEKGGREEQLYMQLFWVRAPPAARVSDGGCVGREGPTKRGKEEPIGTSQWGVGI